LDPPEMKRMELRDRWVVVTGASSGLGREMARQLAGTHGANVVLVARRRDRLEELRAELESTHRVQARVLVADLARPEDVERVFRESTGGAPIDAVILNAGVTYFGPQLELDWSTYEAMVATNQTSVVRLTHLFVPYLLAQKRAGAVLLVTSVAGLIPAPYQAAYSGTKAFVTSFGQACAEELHGQDVSVSVFAPGGIATEMTHTSGLAAQFDGSLALQSAEACAREGLRALLARKPLAVGGWLNRLQVFATRLVPRRLVLVIARTAFRRALAAKAAAAGSPRGAWRWSSSSRWARWRSSAGARSTSRARPRPRHARARAGRPPTGRARRARPWRGSAPADPSITARTAPCSRTARATCPRSRAATTASTRSRRPAPTIAARAAS
jgi:short-subunit dehydrogenase